MVRKPSRRGLTGRQVTCYFDDLTNDTPRNRYFTAALHLAGRRLRTSTIDPAIAARCLSLTSQLERAGVTLDRPNSRVERIRPPKPKRSTTPGLGRPGHRPTSNRRGRVVDARCQPARRRGLPSGPSGPNSRSRSLSNQRGVSRRVSPTGRLKASAIIATSSPAMATSANHCTGPRP